MISCCPETLPRPRSCKSSLVKQLKNKCLAVAEMGDRLAQYMGRQLGAAVPPFWGRGAGSLSNTMWPEQEPTSMPSFILICPAVWPQYTNVTDRKLRCINDIPLLSTTAQVVESARDLGVILDSRLTLSATSQRSLGPGTTSSDNYVRSSSR